MYLGFYMCRLVDTWGIYFPCFSPQNGLKDQYFTDPLSENTVEDKLQILNQSPKDEFQKSL